MQVGRAMYIHVLSIGEVAGVATISSQAILHNVSYVRSLNGPWIVCAVRNGDDTYPTLVDWTKNRSWKLVPRWYIDNANLPWGFLHVSSPPSSFLFFPLPFLRLLTIKPVYDSSARYA